MLLTTRCYTRRECVKQWLAGEAESVRELPFPEIEAATGGFSEAKLLGKGGSCFVFSGDLFGLPVAVKRLDPHKDRGTKQFEREMSLLCTVSHASICRLFAFSTDGPQLCLVLELCDSALDKRIACAEGAAPMTWQHRLQIAHDVASALLHLHSMTPPMLHRDVKSPNILLDAAGNAKVADFGTAREGIYGKGKSHVSTAAAVGTQGCKYFACGCGCRMFTVLLCVLALQLTLALCYTQRPQTCRWNTCSMDSSLQRR
jgi:serine/threonine protein kinase